MFPSDDQLPIQQKFIEHFDVMNFKDANCKLKKFFC